MHNPVGDGVLDVPPKSDATLPVGDGVLDVPPKSDETLRTDKDVRPYARIKFTLYRVRFFGVASE